MKPLYLTSYCSGWAFVGLFLSVVVAPLPARSATLGFIPVGLDSVDSYEQVYVSTTLPDVPRSSIKDYQTSVNEATNGCTLGIDTPFEQALADAGYNPTIIQRVLVKVLNRDSLATTVSDDAGLTAFQFNGTQLAHLISKTEAASLSATSTSGWCMKIRAQLAKNPDSVSISKQSMCW